MPLHDRDSCPRFGRILFAAGCFQTLFDVILTSNTRVIPRKLSFHVAMQNAQNVFESLQGHRCVCVFDRRVGFILPPRIPTRPIDGTNGPPHAVLPPHAESDD